MCWYSSMLSSVLLLSTPTISISWIYILTILTLYYMTVICIFTYAYTYIHVRTYMYVYMYYWIVILFARLTPAQFCSRATHFINALLSIHSSMATMDTWHCQVLLCIRGSRSDRWPTGEEVRSRSVGIGGHLRDWACGMVLVASTVFDVASDVF